MEEGEQITIKWINKAIYELKWHWFDWLVRLYTHTKKIDNKLNYILAISILSFFYFSNFSVCPESRQRLKHEIKKMINVSQTIFKWNFNAVNFHLKKNISSSNYKIK